MITQTVHPNLTLSETAVPDAAHIPPITRAEVDSLARTEWARLLAVVDGLTDADWSKPTACTAWTVRDMVAHQAGAYADMASFREFRRQFLNPPPPDRLPEDRINEIQLADRAHKTNAELIQELRAQGPRTIANRQRVPFFLRAISMPRPDGTKLNLGYMLDVIFSRDTWMHRLDLARATGRDMQLTRAHDGRIVELVMRDVNSQLAPHLQDHSIIIELTGLAGGIWRIGRAANPSAAIRMDALDFNIFASGRSTLAQARAQIVITGDIAFAENALARISVLY